MNRRQLLSSIGVAAVTITSPAVAAARRRKGPPEHAGRPEHADAPDHPNDPEWLHVSGGKIGIDRGQGVSAQVNSDIPTGAKQLDFEIIEQVAEDVNRAIADGRMKIEDRGGMSYLTVTGLDDEGSYQ